MPYTVPPTFSTGATLTAAQLNILADDIEYINSLTDYVNLPYNTYTYGIGGDQSMSERYWVIKHRLRYLHYYLTVDSGSISTSPHALHLDVNWTGTGRTVFSTGSGLTGPSVISGYADLQGNDVVSVPLNIPIGSFMRVYWDAVCTGLATNVYFLESSFTSI